MVVERMKVPRDASRAPIVDASLVWDKLRDNGDWFTATMGDKQAHVRMEWYGATLETFGLDQGGAPTDVGLLIYEVEQTLAANIWYATDLFDRSTIEGMGRAFVMILRAIVDNP